MSIYSIETGPYVERNIKAAKDTFTRNYQSIFKTLFTETIKYDTAVSDL